jgi:hypothetical protein
MRVEQGKGIERRRKEKGRKRLLKKNESERRLKRPNVAFLSSPSKDVRL